MKSFETTNGKKIDMVIDKKTAHIKLQFNPGGELPVELTGLYTTQKEAEQAVNVYLAKKD